MAKFLVTNIKWDVDDNTLEEVGELPTELEVEIGEEDFPEDEWALDDTEVGDILADKISDIVGFCHNGFDWQRVGDNAITTHIKEA